MEPAPVTIPVIAVHGLLAGAAPRLAAADWPALLGQSGIDGALLRAAGARVTGAQYVALLDAVRARLDDEALGLLSRPLRPGSLALVARSALGAPDLAQALERIGAAIDLLQDDLRLTVQDEGRWRGLALRPRGPGAAQSNYLHEYLLRVSWRLLVWLHGGRLRPRGFDFSHPAPPYAAEVAAIFPGELRFGQARSAVWFERAALAAPVRRDEAALGEFLRQSTRQLMLPRQRPPATSARLRQCLLQARPAWPTLAQAAAQLGLAPSTLQRHLALEGSSFQALKDGLRRDLAIARLQQGGVALAALAAELGFSEPAAFQRAFKAWTGSGPGRYRRAAPLS